MRAVLRPTALPRTFRSQLDGASVGDCRRVSIVRSRLAHGEAHAIIMAPT